MQINKIKDLIRAILLMATVSVGLFITPSISSEPVDQPKMALLVPFAFAVLAFMILNFKVVLNENNKSFLIFIALFMTQLGLVVIFSGAPFNQQFFGTFGRNTGFLSYVALSSLALAASWAMDVVGVFRLVYSLIIVGAISIIYSLMQTFAADPIKWNNPYNSILAFLGNPNFASSFTGMCGVAVFALLLRPKTNLASRAFLIIYLISATFVMYRSGSQQGLLVFGAGNLIVLLAYIQGTTRLNRPTVKYSFVGLSVLISALVILGTLKLGPLGTHLYKLSVRQRGFYWQAAKKMMVNHPFFGVGLDSYGDWYFKYRSLNAAFHTPVTQSNAAHNVYLEFGSNGGIPLFLINLILVLIVAISAWKLIRRQTSYNWAFAGLVGAWVAYQAQALISINQLGLAVWGWVLAGAIVGIEFVTRDGSQKSSLISGKPTRNRKSKSSTNYQALVGLLGFTVGAILVAPVFANDANYRNAVQSRNANLIIAAALKSPEDTGRTIQAAQLLLNSKLIPQGIELTKHVLKVHPRDFNAWSLLAGSTQPGSKENVLAANKLKQLNPQIQSK